MVHTFPVMTETPTLSVDALVRLVHFEKWVLPSSWICSQSSALLPKKDQAHLSPEASHIPTDGGQRSVEHKHTRFSRADLEQEDPQWELITSPAGQTGMFVPGGRSEQSIPSE